MRFLGFYFFTFCFSFLYSQQPLQNVAAIAGIIDSCGTASFGFGCSFVDFDNDGFDDLTFATDIGRKMLFYKNNGNGTFSKITPLVQDTSLQRQLLWVDYDNDNDLDLFISSYVGQNRLFEKTSTGFIEVTSTCGLIINPMGFSYGATFGDIDKDGDLDLFISNRGEPNTLYRNNLNIGAKTFTDITAAAGIIQSNDPDFCSAMFDFDNDNDLDIYTIVDRYEFPNKMYQNNGNSSFSEVSSSTGSNLSIEAMNAGVGDYNNDGWFDIYVTNNILGNVLLHNNLGYFADLGTAGVGVNQYCWGAAFVDINNDKFQDLYVCSQNTNPGERNRLFRNNQDETFTEFTSNGLIGDTLSSITLAVGDYNVDGKPDIAVSSIDNDKIILWKNNTTTNNNFIKINLEGVQSNKKGVGSKIVVFDNDSTQYRFTHCGINYLGQNSYVEHFGMGNNTKIDSLIVTWPYANNISKFYNLGVNQQFKIKEGSCLNHTYSGINTAAKKYIGPNNGDVSLDANWSTNKVPTFLDDVEISGPISLTIANGKTLKCRSLKSSNGAVITNNGTLQIKESYGDALVIGTGTIFNNNAIITVNKACGRSTVIEGSFIDKGSMSVSKN